jgi:orotate phosphoribosyltransferase
VVVIEDLISTGGSSLNAVKALRDSGCEVLGMTAIFTYEFKKAADAFTAEKCTLHTLCNYSVLIDTALKTGYITEVDIGTLKKWRVDPSTWGIN